MNYYLEAFRKYAVLDGRARRKEYWYFALVNGLILTPSAFIGIISSLAFTPLSLLIAAYALSALIPALSVSVRRLHDTDRSGWWLLINFLPYIGFLSYVVLMCLPGTPGVNKYGPNPLTNPDNAPNEQST